MRCLDPIVCVTLWSLSSHTTTTSHRCRPAGSRARSMQDKSAGITVSSSREKSDSEAPGDLFLPLLSLSQSFISTIFIRSSFITGTTVPLNSLATYPSFVLALCHWPLLIMFSVSGLSMVLFTWRIMMTNNFFQILYLEGEQMTKRQRTKISPSPKISL